MGTLPTTATRRSDGVGRSRGRWAVAGRSRRGSGVLARRERGGMGPGIGAKRLLMPMASVGDIPTIPGELFAKFQTSFYADPKDAVFKALGVH